MLAWLKRPHDSAHFGSRSYPSCPSHTAAAEAVRRAIAVLTKTRYTEVSLDETVEHVLGYPGSGPLRGMDSLEAVERLMALEEEHGELPSDAMDDPVAEAVLATLLGPARQTTAWDSRTVWARSIRAIINARVADAQCSCVEDPAAQQGDGADKPQP